MGRRSARRGGWRRGGWTRRETNSRDADAWSRGRCGRVRARDRGAHAPSSQLCRPSVRVGKAQPALDKGGWNGDDVATRPRAALGRRAPFPDSYAARIASDERTPVMPRDAVASTARRVRAAPSPARRSRSLFRPHPSRKNPLVATPTVAGLRRRCEDATYLDGRADEGGHGNGESGHVVWSKNDECGVCERAPGVSARRLTRGFLTNFLPPKPLTPKNEAGGVYTSVKYSGK